MKTPRSRITTPEAVGISLVGFSLFGAILLSAWTVNDETTAPKFSIDVACPNNLTPQVTEDTLSQQYAENDTLTHDSKTVQISCGGAALRLSVSSRE